MNILFLTPTHLKVDIAKSETDLWDATLAIELTTSGGMFRGTYRWVEMCQRGAVVVADVSCNGIPYELQLDFDVPKDHILCYDQVYVEIFKQAKASLDLWAPTQEEVQARLDT